MKITLQCIVIFLAHESLMYFLTITWFLPFFLSIKDYLKMASEMQKVVIVEKVFVKKARKKLCPLSHGTSSLNLDWVSWSAFQGNT